MVMLVRPTPLDVPDDVVRAWFEKLPDLPLPEGGDRAAVWFDDFAEANDPTRTRTFDVVGSDDPFAKWQLSSLLPIRERRSRSPLRSHRSQVTIESSREEKSMIRFMPMLAGILVVAFPASVACPRAGSGLSHGTTLHRSGRGEPRARHRAGSRGRQGRPHARRQGVGRRPESQGDCRSEIWGELPPSWLPL